MHTYTYIWAMIRVPAESQDSPFSRRERELLSTCAIAVSGLDAKSSQQDFIKHQLVLGSTGGSRGGDRYLKNVSL